MDEQSAQAMAVAMTWVARIFASALIVVLPSVAGGYLDRAFGVRFLSPTGLILGAIAGFAYLLAVTRSASLPRDPRSESTPPSERSEDNSRR